MLDKIKNIGVYPELPAPLVHKIKIFNSANFFILLINLFYLVQGIIKGLILANILSFYSILSILFALWLVHRKKTIVGFHFIMIYAIIFIGCFSLLFGFKTNTYLYFIFTPVAIVILFDAIKTIIIYTTVITLIACSSYYIQLNFYESFYDKEVTSKMEIFGYTNYLFIILLIFLGVLQFKLLNKKYSDEIEQNRESLEEKNKEITDSIQYAKNIQHALLPKEEEFRQNFTDYFLFFQPKDIVSGDFYWIHKIQNNIYWAVGDCTGHGVPGGFMTMLGISFLEEIVNAQPEIETSEILNQLRDKIVHALKQNANYGESKDGMDISLCKLNIESNELCFSGANNGIVILKEKECITLKPDKQPCGFFDKPLPFNQEKIHLNKDNWIINYTDGYTDQFGGPKGKKMKYKGMIEIINKNKLENGNAFFRIIKTEFENWKGQLEQVDDICLTGIKI